MKAVVTKQKELSKLIYSFIKKDSVESYYLNICSFKV